MMEAGGEPLVRAHRAVCELLEADLTACPDAEVLDRWRELERLRNRLAAVEHVFVAEVERRGLPTDAGAVSTAAFVRGLLRVEPGEAKARVAAAHAAGPRRSLVGERLEPAFPLVAAAQRAGDVSPAHARVITRTIQALPDAALDRADGVEADLVGHAEDFDPLQLAKIAIRVAAWLDPDGLLADHAYRERHRELGLHVRADGSGVLRGDLTAQTTERLQCVFDALAAPRPAEDGTPDTRTAGQRRHDALLDLTEMAQLTNQLPTAGGVSSTLILTTTRAGWQAGEGLARTGHGALVPNREAQRWIGGDTRVLSVQLTEPATPVKPGTGEIARDPAIAGMSSLQRTFTERQRLALIARDRGCSFPGCDRPPQWCQAHHVIAWQDGGSTSIDNGTLLCGHHHRSFERLGWACQMSDGTPQWFPPTWLDPQRQPRTNHAHV